MGNGCSEMLLFDANTALHEVCYLVAVSSACLEQSRVLVKYRQTIVLHQSSACNRHLTGMALSSVFLLSFAHAPLDEHIIRKQVAEDLVVQ